LNLLNRSKSIILLMKGHLLVEIGTISCEFAPDSSFDFCDLLEGGCARVAHLGLDSGADLPHFLQAAPRLSCPHLKLLF